MYSLWLLNIEYRKEVILFQSKIYKLPVSLQWANYVIGLPKTWMDLEPPGISSPEWCIVSRTRWLSQSVWGICAGVGVLLYEEHKPVAPHSQKGRHSGGECKTMPGSSRQRSSSGNGKPNSSCLSHKGTRLNYMAKKQVLLIFGRTWSSKSPLALFLVGFFLHGPRPAIGVPGQPASRCKGKSRSLSTLGFSLIGSV